VTTERYRRRPDALWRRSLDAVVVLPPGEGAEPVTIGGTGPELWDALADWRTLADLAEALALRHRADADVVAADVAPILERLVACGAVERAADSEPGHAR